MVADHSSAEFWDVVLEIYQVLGLLVRCDIIEVNILVTPLEVMDDPLVCQLLLHNEDVLEEVDDPLLDVEVVELGDHRFLVLQVPLVLVDQSIPLVDHVSDVVEDSAVCAKIKLGQFVRQILIFLFFLLELVVHILDLNIIPL